MSAENVFAEVMQSEEDKREQQKIAQVKKQGYFYFKLLYLGRLPVAQIKIQGLKNIEAYKSTDDNGNEIWVGKPGADAYFFREDSLGNKMTQIWDDADGYNRAWVSRHIGFDRAEFEVEDKKIETEILGIKNKPYKVELGEKELLEKQLRDTEKRLDELRKRKDAMTEKTEMQKTETQNVASTESQSLESPDLLVKHRGRRKTIQSPTEEVVQEA